MRAVTFRITSATVPNLWVCDSDNVIAGWASTDSAIVSSNPQLTIGTVNSLLPPVGEEFLLYLFFGALSGIAFPIYRSQEIYVSAAAATVIQLILNT